MLFNIGDIVTRNSHNNDVIFEIIEIKEHTAYLKGIDIRLYADSSLEDLKLSNIDFDDRNDSNCVEKVKELIPENRSEFFYLPGKILHIDGDKSYLDRCMKFYKNLNIMAQGFSISESDVQFKIKDLLKTYKPNILVITGHDAMYKNNNNIIYKNSDNFINSILEARQFEDNQEKLIIVAGACQSNYEELIKCGANFASSPKRINIHALDPAIVASSIALSEKNKPINLIEILEKTKYKSEGIGGIITNGTMYKGYPR